MNIPVIHRREDGKLIYLGTCTMSTVSLTEINDYNGDNDLRHIVDEFSVVLQQAISVEKDTMVPAVHSGKMIRKAKAVSIDDIVLHRDIKHLTAILPTYNDKFCDGFDYINLIDKKYVIELKNNYTVTYFDYCVSENEEIIMEIEYTAKDRPNPCDAYRHKCTYVNSDEIDVSNLVYTFEQQPIAMKMLISFENKIVMAAYQHAVNKIHIVGTSKHPRNKGDQLYDIPIMDFADFADRNIEMYSDMKDIQLHIKPVIGNIVSELSITYIQAESPEQLVELINSITTQIPTFETEYTFISIKVLPTTMDDMN